MTYDHFLKLNGSLTHRIADLAEAKEKITQLEVDVHEARKEAEKLAKELEDYETELTADDAEAIIEVAEIVPVQPSSPAQSRRSSTPMSPTLLSIPAPASPAAHRSSFGSQSVLPPPVSQLKEKENEAKDVPDTVSIRSSHSTRSAKSAKSTRSAQGGELSRTSSVHAAKRKSHRTSQSSLRLSGHSRKQSSIRIKSLQQEQTPLPELRLRFTDNAMPAVTPYASSTLLLLDSHNPSLRRQGSLDTVCTSRDPATSAATVAFRGRSTDDMYLRPYNASSSEIQLVPRSQAYNVTAPKYETPMPETNIIGHFPSKSHGLYLAHHLSFFLSFF